MIENNKIVKWKTLFHLVCKGGQFDGVKYQFECSECEWNDSGLFAVQSGNSVVIFSPSPQIIS